MVYYLGWVGEDKRFSRGGLVVSFDSIKDKFIYLLPQNCLAEYSWVVDIHTRKASIFSLVSYGI